MITAPMLRASFSADTEWPCMRVCALAVSWVLAAAVGCGGLADVPIHGGQAWLRVEGKSFTLYTDQSRESAIASLRELEHLLAAFLQLGWEAKGKPRGRLSVVMFADESDFRELSGPDVDGTYHREVLLDPWVVTSANARGPRLSVLKHELTHRIADLAIGHQPAWFAEGIATFFETAYFDQAGRFVVGAVPRDMAEVLKRRRMPAEQLLSPEVDTRTPVFYATAWLLVHYLMMEHADAFAEYQRALAAGAEAPLAWATAFGSLAQSELDTRLEAYATDGVFEGTRQQVELPSVLLRVETLGDADVHALRAQMFLTCEDCGDHTSRGHRARLELDGALRADPDHLWANGLALSYLAESPTQRLPSADHLVKAHPDAALAWVLKARTLERDRGPAAEIRSAAEHALALAPEHPVIRMLAARAALDGDMKRALRLSDEALRQRPADARLLAERGAVLHAAGLCRQLATLRARASQLAHRRGEPLQTLAELVGNCAARAPGTRTEAAPETGTALGTGAAPVPGTGAETETGTAPETGTGAGTVAVPETGTGTAAMPEAVPEAAR